MEYLKLKPYCSDSFSKNNLEKKVPPKLERKIMKTPVFNSCGSGCKKNAKLLLHFANPSTVVSNSNFPSHCKVQILSNHSIKWHMLLSHVANQFLRHLSCLSGLPRSCLGASLQCLGEVHLVRDHAASQLQESRQIGLHISYT